MRWGLLLALVLAASPAVAGPEFQLGIGADAGATPNVSYGPVVEFRAALGWRFAGHVLALGLRGADEPKFTGTAISPWGAYRTPAWRLREHFGLVGLLGARVAEFPVAGRSHLSPIIGVGLGVVVSAGAMSVLPSLELAAAWPGTEHVPWLVVPTFNVSLLLGDAEESGVSLPDPLGARVTLSLGYMHTSRPTARFDAPGDLAIATLDLGVRLEAHDVGLRLQVAGGTGVLGGLGVLGYAGIGLGRTGPFVTRATVGFGVATVEEGGGGDAIEYGWEPTSALELGLLWPLGSFDVGLAVTSSVTRHETLEGAVPLFGLGLATRFAWNGGEGRR